MEGTRIALLIEKSRELQPVVLTQQEPHTKSITQQAQRSPQETINNSL